MDDAKLDRLIELLEILVFRGQSSPVAVNVTMGTPPPTEDDAGRKKRESLLALAANAPVPSPG